MLHLDRSTFGANVAHGAGFLPFAGEAVDEPELDRWDVARLGLAVQRQLDLFVAETEGLLVLLLEVGVFSQTDLKVVAEPAQLRQGVLDTLPLRYTRDQLHPVDLGEAGECQ